jgi:hypothetical protein
VTQNSVEEGGVIMSTRGKKVPDGRSSLRPSEKEVPKRCSDAFRHKNIPVCTFIHLLP